MSLLFRPDSKDEHMGLEISDLMMTLVAIFLMGSVLMKNQVDEYREIKTFNQQYLDELIVKEFSSVLSEPSIELFEGGLLRFRGKFESNKSEITPEIAAQLQGMCPLLLRFVTEYPDIVKAVYFEGHTNDSWGDPKNTAYYGNKIISEGRAVNTMRYCLGETFENTHPDLMNKFIAIGYSYTRPVYHPTGEVDRDASKRVDIRLVAKRSADVDL